MEILHQSTKDLLSRLLTTSIQIEKHDYSNQDEVYKIHTPEKNFYLKIAPTLQAEYENLLKIRSHLEVPRVINFSKIADRDHLLISEVPGKNLAELTKLWEDVVIVREFAKAVRNFHALDINILFPGVVNTSKLVVLHGDMSLPNVICIKPGLPAAYIDLGQMSIGNPETDLADALWSLQRNIGPGYGELFLKEYGDVVMTEKIEKALNFKYSP